MTLEELLRSRYVKFGREFPDLDCWGLTRLARSVLFEKGLLASHVGISPDDKRALTAAAEGVRCEGGFRQVAPRAGVIAAAWRGRLCVHVGLVVETDGRMWILETDEATGPKLSRLDAFEGAYTRVIYYDD